MPIEGGANGQSFAITVFAKSASPRFRASESRPGGAITRRDTPMS